MSIHSSRLAAFTLIFLALPVAADEAADDRVIDEITVTADFRKRALLEVPFSVSVLDAEFLKDSSVQHFEELVNVIPNMNWSGDGHRARYFQIRGVGELEQYQGAPNPSIGFLVDDIDFSGIGTIATLFDVESIEVLRGAQGSRYGANALGGLIYLRSTEPTVEQDARVQVTLGEDDAVSVGAAFGGRLNESGSATFRISAQKHESDGFRRNAYLQRDDTNARDESTVRARLRLQPSDTLEVNMALLVADVDNGYDAFALDNSLTVQSNRPGRDAQKSVGASLRFDWRLPVVGALTSITTAAKSEIDYGFDADWGSSESWDPFTYDYVSLRERERTTISQEFRFSSERWIFGFYALALEDRLDTLDQGDYYDPFFDFADSLDVSFASKFEASNVAVFGQYNQELSDKISVSSGLRVERRGTDYQDTDGLRASPSESMWGGEISINYSLANSVMTFATFSRSYRAGGFNLGLVPDERRSFDDEALWALELGLKARFLDSSLMVNASIFQNWRVDQQVRTTFQLIQGDPSSFGFATLNVEAARSRGAEAEVRYLPHQNWELYANVGLLDGSFKDVPVDIDSLLGRADAHAPRYTLAAGVAYRGDNGFFARLDATAKDAFFFDVSHSQKSRSFELVNTRVGIDGEHWRASLWVRNLFDRRYAVRGFFFGNEPPNFPNTLYTRLGDPRQIGVTVERRF